MKTSCRLRRAPPCGPESPCFSWSFIGILLVAQGLLLPISTDACGDLPGYETMKPKGNPAPPFNVGDRVEYECRPGYRFIVPPVRPTATTCQSDSTWDPPLLQEACTRKSCPQLPEPVNGRINGTFQFGSEAHYSCNEGYYLLGEKVLYCELSGDNVGWSANPPTCEKILCQPPPQIPNGDFTNSHKVSFEYNEIVIYSCKGSNGTDEYSLVGENKLICSGHNKWSSGPPECKVVKCEYPRVVNGKLVSGFGTKFYYKAEVEFECHPGYSLEGSSKSVCQANSTWEPKLPTCVKVLTSPPSTKPPLTYPASTTPSTKPPVPSVTAVKPIQPTKPPVSSSPGVKPIPSTKPPVSSSPGHPTPGDETPSGLDTGAIVGITLAVVIVALAIGYGLYRYTKKKGETDVSAAYTAYQNKASTPVQ